MYQRIIREQLLTLILIKFPSELLPIQPFPSMWKDDFFNTFVSHKLVGSASHLNPD